MVVTGIVGGRLWPRHAARRCLAIVITNALIHRLVIAVMSHQMAAAAHADECGRCGMGILIVFAYAGWAIITTLMALGLGAVVAKRQRDLDTPTLPRAIVRGS